MMSLDERFAPPSFCGLMDCQQLAAQISKLQPELAPADVARLCLLLFNHAEDPDRLSDRDHLLSEWQRISFKLEVATDQHFAVSEELDALCGDEPIKFTPDQLWTLLRTVKVQSQHLDLYTDQAFLV